MSLLVKGITKLSELEIDVDKDWSTKGISNIKEIAASMKVGEITQHSGVLLTKLPPGADGLVLTSQGPGKLVVWAPGGTYYHRFFPVFINLEHAEGIVAVDKSHEESVPLTSEHKQAYTDAPTDYIKRVDAAIALTDAETAGITPDQTHQETPAITRKYDLEIVVGGACAYDVDDATPYDDETTEAQNATLNDMILLPATPAVNDAYYFGHAKKFDVLILNVGTNGAGTFTIAWEYWNGANWVALVGLTDSTSGFKGGTGKREVSHTPQGDWAATNSGGDLPANIYWIRARVTAYTGDGYVRPLGTQAWIRIVT